jgi:hypothetical protein
METSTPGDTNAPENSAPGDALRIQALERALLDAENRAQKYAQEAKSAQSLQKGCMEELRQLRHDYESLRVQKGGFGFKTLLLWGFAGFLSGLVLCYLFFRPKDERAVAFEHFKRENLFPIEYAISQGKFDETDKTLAGSLDTKAYRLIKPEIDMIRKINAAAKRRCLTREQ